MVELGVAKSLREHIIALVLVVVITVAATMAIDLLPPPADAEALFSTTAAIIGVALLLVPLVAGVVGGVLIAKRDGKIALCAKVSAAGAAIATLLIFGYNIAIFTLQGPIPWNGVLGIALLLCINVVLYAAAAALGGVLGGFIAKRKHA